MSPSKQPFDEPDIRELPDDPTKPPGDDERSGGDPVDDLLPLR
jgi:hypothetical protein